MSVKLTEDLKATLISAKRTGHLKPELQAMTDEEFLDWWVKLPYPKDAPSQADKLEKQEQ